ncbi:MAG: protein phosphatase [Epsilonproteobacteria bacterium]|nr:protein phosphatase [Campylobacterota bacterium]
MPYVIYGDIHGCLEEWMELRKEIPKNSIEICVGDLVDKGPLSHECLRFAQKNKILSTLGNHEYKHLRKYIGRKVTLDEDQQKVYPTLTKDDFEYIKNMPLFFKLNRLLILHAGITNKITLNDSFKKLTHLLYLRDIDENENFLPLNHTCNNARHWADVYEGGEGFVVYGHQPFLDVKKRRHSIGIDTGCVYGYKLSAYIIYDTFKPFKGKIIQVNAKKRYAEPSFEILAP